MQENVSLLAKILPFQSKKKSDQSPELREMLQDKEVQDFYKFVHEYDLRVDAIRLLEARINKSEDN